MLEGVDISYAQGNYQPGSETFVVVNASRGNQGYLQTGSYYRSQVATCRARGKEVGHYFFNGNLDPTACAEFFVANLYDFRPGDVLVLDVEAEPSSGTAAWNPTQSLAFAVRVKQLTGQNVGIYLNKSLMTGMDWSKVVAFGCWLWIAYYNDSPPNPSYWPNWTMWQYTSAGGLDRNKSQQTLAAISGGGSGVKNDEEEMSGLPVAIGNNTLIWNGVPNTYDPQIYQVIVGAYGLTERVQGPWAWAYQTIVDRSWDAYNYVLNDVVSKTVAGVVGQLPAGSVDQDALAAAIAEKVIAGIPKFDTSDLNITLTGTAVPKEA